MRPVRILMMDVDGVIVRGRPLDGLHWSTDLQADLGLDSGLLQAAFFQSHWQDIVTGRSRLRDRLAPVFAILLPPYRATG